MLYLIVRISFLIQYNTFTLIFLCYLALYFLMLEEPKAKIKSLQKKKIVTVNEQVVKLLQEKTLPLNRMRYLHLQKIHQAIRKNTQEKYSSSVQLTTINNSSSETQRLPTFCKSRTSRIHPMVTADLLINRLKNLKDLKNASLLLSQNEKVGHCWQTLRSSIIQTDITRTNSKNMSKAASQKGMNASRNCRRKKQNLLELAQRAQKYLRLKKHQLKQKYCQQQQYRENKRKKPIKPTQIQMLLTSFKSAKDKDKDSIMNDHQLQKELLKDIRQNMFQQKINRLKRDINHKKIVQMR